MATFTDFYGTLDPDPQVRGREFEHVCRWFLSNDPTYKSALRKVWLWDEWPGRWGIDAGIDLVAEDHAGKLWAIQSKAYAAGNAVTKEDVNTFLSESARAQISYRLLIATTDRIGSTAQRTIDDQEKPVGFVGLADLLTAELDWPESLADLRPAQPLEPAKPRDYQREAIDAVIAGFGTADRGQLIMACGTGKTLTAQFIAGELNAARTLVLVPSLSLLKQTMRVWQANSASGFEVLPVCSDATVGRDEDAPITRASELGVPVTTDPTDIAAFLREPGPRVVFSSYQSSPRIAAAQALADVPGFDLVIADEAHRCAGPVSSEFATVLDGAAIRAERRLFMTATPRYYTGRIVKAARESDFEVASMDDGSKFGTVFHRLGFSEAIRRDLLTDYQVAVVGVDDATYRQWAETGRFVRRDDGAETDARSLAGQIGLAKAIKKYNLRRTISFHSRVKSAREFAAELPDVIAWMPADQRPAGELWAKYASGEMSAGERHVLLQHLSRLDDGERGLLANARCLAEGVDVPALDGVAFIDPRRSEVDIVQAVGRAIRKSDDKSIGTIVIPVFIDTDADPEVALDDSVFKPVWDIIKALRAHDDELAEQIDSLRREMGRHRAAPKLPSKIKLDIPITVEARFAEAFEARLVEQTSAVWEEWYGLLLDYVEENRTALLKQSYAVGAYRLGQWITIQRGHYSKGRLSADRQRLLEVLPGWSWDPKADLWEDGFDHFQAYVEENGTAGIRDDYVCGDGYRLGKWVGKQRTKWESLPQDRKHRLQELPGWTLDARVTLWEASLAALIHYAEESGHTSPPRGLKVEGIELDSWIRRQRKTWDQLTEERKERLKALPGWTLNVLDAQWDIAYQHLLGYVEENGTAQVKQSYVAPDGYRLGKWVSVQRRIWSKLSNDRKQRLEQLPGWTLNARGDWWENWFRMLQEYVAEYGTARVPQTFVTADGDKLGAWVANQKSTRKTLSDERRERLEALPGWTYDTHTAYWEDGFRYLAEYVEEHGVAQPSSKCVVNGFKLGIWVNTQRQTWDTLSDERRERLESLPGWVLNTKSAQWEEGYECLRRYVAEFGTSLVPTYCVYEDFKLGQWVGVQRASWKMLKPDRKGLLAALPGWAVSARDAWWEEGFRQLQVYAAQTGNASPAQSHSTDDGFNLGPWVATQRATRVQGKMPAERQARLEALPGWEWTARPGPRR
ncbi:Helicase associated domain protein [Mycobacterium sp. M1]|uniref:Helicase associated domain protein n=1 Tax=Mycolicibacter acidiphilus TaxID=2835306 RepID=A0ABS5REC3_9MYCO|nr:DEAD/DEAH box helicase [Mycolicibacter acidiphilus]MBS9532627.1 Helicase associated domain protein [Mycolicibacter acidiphilus]